MIVNSKLRAINGEPIVWINERIDFNLTVYVRDAHAE